MSSRRSALLLDGSVKPGPGRGLRWILLWTLAALPAGALPAPAESPVAEAGPTSSAGQLRHVLLLAIAPSTPPVKLREIEASMAALARPSGDVLAGEWGRDVTGGARTQGYTHVLAQTFRDAAAIDRYRDAPAHRAFVALTTPFLTKPPLVLDYRAD
jgi:hypothetical protein